jgi:hypothetical protein
VPLQKYLDLAISLCPTDGSLLHMRGRWAYHVAGLSILERLAATAFYATPPTATYADALAYLLEVA